MFTLCCQKLIRSLIIAGVFIFLFYAVSHAFEITQLPTPKTNGVITTLPGTQYMLCDNCTVLTVFTDVPPPPKKPPTPSLAMKFSTEPTRIAKAEPPKEPVQVATAEKPILTVYFDFNSWHLKGVERKKIKDALPSLKSADALKVTGYTCDVGSQPVNDELALRRARAVASYLREVGIKGEDLSVEGRGKCCYTDPDRRSLNRRAEITRK
jgi:outer membrane protein OmpA-like peptidoglycan-associated protein